MYKRQADPISFPGPNRGYQYASPSFFSIKNLIWPPDPLNKGKMDFFLHFWAPWSFYFKNSSKNVQKNSKNAKNTAESTNILSKKAKSPIIPLPPLGKLAFYTRVLWSPANNTFCSPPFPVHYHYNFRIHFMAHGGGHTGLWLYTNSLISFMISDFGLCS